MKRIRAEISKLLLMLVRSILFHYYQLLRKHKGMLIIGMEFALSHL